MIKKIIGKPVPINYFNKSLYERWCIVTVTDGKFKGEMVSLVATFEDESVVDLGSGSPYYETDEDFTLVTIPNKYLDFDLEKHLETNRLLEEMNKDLTKPSNPKDALGIKKAPISTVPANVMLETGLALLEGARKYGRHNYRIMGVRASVYYDAVVGRHLAQWWEGEDIDPDSGLSHITKAIAGLVVLRDAMMNDNWNDDRPPKVKNQNWVRDMNNKASEIIEKYPVSLEPYTEINKNE